MKKYYRVMLGKGGIYLDEALKGGFIGVDFGVHRDFSGQFPDSWRDFNHTYIPLFLAKQPGRSKVAAGLAGGTTWTLGRGMRQGDIVLTPDGLGHYRVGEIQGQYYFQSNDILPHRRPVRWFEDPIDRADMSEALRNSAGSGGTLADLTRYHEELEALINRKPPSPIRSADEDIEDPYAFAMEKHLEEFLVRNWSHTKLGKTYKIYEEGGELVGTQYPTDTGPLDLLAISNDGKTLLVIELKKGRATDVVVGQVLRYMGYVKEELAEPHQEVKGAIIAQEGDVRIRRALAMVPDIEFYRYQVKFNLIKG